MDKEETASSFQAQFNRDGYLCLPKVLPLERVEQWAETYGDPSILEGIFQDLFDQHHIAVPCHRHKTPSDQYTLRQGVKNGFAEIVMRSPGRYEISISQHGDTLWEILQRNLPFLPDLFSDNASHRVSWKELRLVNCSVVLSTPGAPNQAWHADGAHINLTKHQPCHCLNVFCPLLPKQTSDCGPTQLRPGSHVYTRDLTKLLLLAKARKQCRPVVAPVLERGDCLLFDYRLLHRGLANRSNHNRPVLVWTVSRDWFRDVCNFPKRSLYDATACDETDG